MKIFFIIQIPVFHKHLESDLRMDKMWSMKSGSSFGHRYKALGITMLIIAVLIMKTSGDCKCPKEWNTEYPTQKFCGFELLGSSCHSETLYNCSRSNEIPIPSWNCTTQAKRSNGFCFIPLPKNCLIDDTTVSKPCLLRRSCVDWKTSRRFKSDPRVHPY
jgi:hypothetical protein